MAKQKFDTELRSFVTEAHYNYSNSSSNSSNSIVVTISFTHSIIKSQFTVKLVTYTLLSLATTGLTSSMLLEDFN